MKLTQYRVKRETGFTMMEILVAIIIIGILTAIAIPIYLNQRKKAHIASAKQELRQIANFMDDYYLRNETYLINKVPQSTDTARELIKNAGLYEKTNVFNSNTHNGFWCFPANTQTYAFVYWNPLVGEGNAATHASKGTKTWMVDNTGVIRELTMSQTGVSKWIGHTACSIATKDLPGYNKNYWTDATQEQHRINNVQAVLWTHDIDAYV